MGGPDALARPQTGLRGRMLPRSLAWADSGLGERSSPRARIMILSYSLPASSRESETGSDGPPGECRMKISMHLSRRAIGLAGKGTTVAVMRCLLVPVGCAASSGPGGRGRQLFGSRGAGPTARARACYIGTSDPNLRPTPSMAPHRDGGSPPDSPSSRVPLARWRAASRRGNEGRRLRQPLRRSCAPGKRTKSAAPVGASERPLSDPPLLAV